MAYRRRVYKKSLYHTLRARPYLLYNGQSCNSICTKAKDCGAFIDGLNLLKKLPVHEGCVNTIAWNRTGEYLLSGSDDFNLCITNPLHNERSSRFKSMAKISSGHTSNIFSAQFMPNSMDRSLVSCAQDGTVIALDIDAYEMKGVSRFNCHSSTAYEVAIIPDTSDTFMSCSEDKTVRLFDLRSSRSCIGENCRQNILIKSSHAITTLSMNPRNPRQFLIGRADGTGLVYDQRMLSVSSASSGLKSYLHPLHGVVSKFVVPEFDQNYRFTSLCYSPDGSQILASYSGEYVYLFTIDRSSIVDPDKCLSKSGPSSSSKQSPASSSQLSSPQHNKGEQSAPAATTNRTTEDASRSMPRLRVRGDWSDTGPSSRPDSEGQDDGSVVGGLINLASRILESVPGRGNDEASQESANPDNRQERPRGQRSIFIPISAIQTLRSRSLGANDEDDDEDDEDEDDDDEDDDEELNHTTDDDSDIHQDFDNDLVEARKNSGSNSLIDSGASHNDIGDRQASANTEVANVKDETNESNNNNIHGSGDKASGASQRRPISQATREKFVKYFADPLKEASKRIPAYGPTRCYKGHRNTRTSIKEATFWGDDYVLSGSDCGRIFMWNKHTGQVVLLWTGDERVVNSIAPNPYDFVLATSGIEYDIKLWTTQSELDGPLKYPPDMIHSIMLRNEAMLKEARDTITLPPQLFFRLLASLAR